MAADLIQTWLERVEEATAGAAPVSEPSPGAVSVGDPRAPLTVRAALRSLGGRLEVRRVGQLEPDDLLSVGSDEATVVIDAVRGINPGAIIRRSMVDLASGGPAPRSSHMLPLQDVLALVVALRGSLPDGVFVGLGGATFGLGEPASAAVLEAVPSLAAVTVEEARRLATD